MRTISNFNDGWRFKKSAQIPTELPEWEEVALPHTWNASDGQDGGNDYWRGTGTYIKAFANPEKPVGGRVILEFSGVAMTADVYVNGTHLARHEGGYSIFRVDVTEYLQAINILCVAVDNSASDRVYPQKADFTFYGGIYRDVKMLILPREHFEVCDDGTPGIRITPVVDGNKAVVTAETWQTGSGDVVITVDGQTQTVISERGYAKAEFLIENVHLWNGVEDPYLYTARAVFGEDEIFVRFGCRRIAFDPQQGFFLNGHPYPLHGISRHQDRKGMGNALTEAEHKEDMELIREMGANAIRLAHYQHDQYFYDLCDEYGMVVWAEIPYITKHMPEGRENTLAQMRELIVQNYNHPSIVCWGLSNEITVSGGVTEDLMENHRQLNELCHRLDATRPASMANAFMLETDSPLLEVPDILGYNLYYGWYVGELEENDRFFDEFHDRYPNRAIALTEYGADANCRFQTNVPERGDYTEQYQCVYHEHMLSMLAKRPYIWGSFVWNMFDFAADGRDEGGAHGINQKGLVGFDRKLKKDAFFLYKAYWSREPFIHICGRRYVDRAEESTEIRVYTNQPEVSLYCDGTKIGQKEGAYIFRFELPLSGGHIIEARAGELTDTIRIRKVGSPNPDYAMTCSDSVANWFDAEGVKEGYFSINDKMGDIRQNPKGAALVDKLMAAARATRGDVAQSTQGNPVLEKMLSNMTIVALLKQAGDAIPPETVRQLNAALQQIKKSE